jgi:hypothetical protein
MEETITVQSPIEVKEYPLGGTLINLDHDREYQQLAKELLQDDDDRPSWPIDGI